MTLKDKIVIYLLASINVIIGIIFAIPVLGFLILVNDIALTKGGFKGAESLLFVCFFAETILAYPFIVGSIGLAMMKNSGRIILLVTSGLIILVSVVDWLVMLLTYPYPKAEGAVRYFSEHWFMWFFSIYAALQLWLFRRKVQ